MKNVLNLFSFCFLLLGPAAGQPADSSVTLTRDGAWCWFSDPRAVYFEGEYRRTYLGWVDSRGNITVGYRDHDSGVFQSRTLHSELEVDDHDHPALLFTADGRLLVFYSRHATSDPICLLEARQPESLAEWAPRRELALNDTAAYRGRLNSYTYAHPVRLAGEGDRLYLFWRGMDFKPNVARSDDLAGTWSAGKILILPERTYANRRPYLKVADNGRDRIHLAFTDGHPQNEPTNSVYYASYRADTFYRADGRRLAHWDQLPLRPQKADLVYDAAATGERAWVWDVAADSTGRPAIVYARFPNERTHVYYYARWDGAAWQNHKMGEAGGWFPQTPEGETEREPYYSGGLALDQEDPSVVYVSREVNGVFELERWSTPDEGKTWATEKITEGSRNDNVRPAAVRGAGEGNPLQVLWLGVRRYGHYTDYLSSVKGW